MKRNGPTLGTVLLATGLLLGCQDSGASPLTPELPAPQLDHKPSHSPPGAGGGGDKTQECQIKFDLTFGDFGGDGIADPMRSDGLGTYYSGVDRVGAGTGSGDGFRFDTNGSQKIEANNDRRWVTLDFSGTAFPGANETDGLGNPIPKGIDLRFTDHPDGTRLNLCALEVGESDHVPVTIRFNASDVEFNPSDANAELGYGGVSRGFDCGPPGVSEVTVTRTALDTWVLESGPTACYTTRDPDGTMNQFQFRGLVDMPFKFTIVAQP